VEYAVNHRAKGGDDLISRVASNEAVGYAFVGVAAGHPVSLEERRTLERT